MSDKTRIVFIPLVTLPNEQIAEGKRDRRRGPTTSKRLINLGTLILRRLVQASADHHRWPQVLQKNAQSSNTNTTIVSMIGMQTSALLSCTVANVDFCKERDEQMDVRTYLTSIVLVSRYFTLNIQAHSRHN
jgi:hypothetical protein